MVIRVGPNLAQLISLSKEMKNGQVLRKDHVKTQAEDGHSQAEEEASEEKNTVTC